MFFVVIQNCRQCFIPIPLDKYHRVQCTGKTPPTRRYALMLTPRLIDDIHRMTSNSPISHLSRFSLPPRSRRNLILNRLQPSQIKPGAEKHDREIEYTEGQEHVKIHPLIIIVDAEALGEFITVGILTELAQAVGAILDVAAEL